MKAQAALNEDVIEVVQHIQDKADSWDFDITPDTVEELIGESSFELGIDLDGEQKTDAVDILLND